MNVEELLALNNITLPDTAAGRHYTICPHCSRERKRSHQKLKCLGVTIAGDRVRWGCNHCGWTGPERGGSGNGGGEYHDAQTSYRYGPELRKVRNPKKAGPKYYWQHLGGVGVWEAGTGGVPTAHLLYRIDEVKASIEAGEIIVVVEGEKDVETLRKLGITATCNAHGASEEGKTPKWTRKHSEQLRGADLVVLNDHDPAGYAHADAIVNLSSDVARRIGRLDLSYHWPGDNMPAGYDVSDMLEARAIDAETLTELITAALPPLPPPPKPVLELLYGEDAAKPQPMGTIVRGLMHRGSLTLFYGPPKSGKSFLVTDLFMAIAAGDPDWMGHKIVRPGPVLYVACEGHSGFWKRLAAAKHRRGPLFELPQNFVLARGRPVLIELSDHGRVAIPHPIDVLNAMEQMRERGQNPLAIAIDTVFRAIGAGNVNSSDHMNILLAAIGAITDHDTGVAAVHHEIKSGGSPAGSVSLMGGADTIVRTQNLDDGNHSWEIEFAKDDATTEARKFRLEVIDLGTDPEDEPASSCVITPVAGRVVKAGKLKPEHEELRIILIDAFADLGRDDRPEPGMPTVKTISREQLRHALVRKSWFSEEHLDGVSVMKRGLTDENNALTALRRRNLIGFNRVHVWLI